jgi:hypothetical protein
MQQASSVLLRGLCSLCEEPSSSCWWSPPSAGCYWSSKTNSLIYGFASMLMQYLLLAGMPGSILVCTYFLFRLILAADGHQSPRLDILHSAINLDVNLNLANFLTLGWWCIIILLLRVIFNLIGIIPIYRCCGTMVFKALKRFKAMGGRFIRFRTPRRALWTLRRLKRAFFQSGREALRRSGVA